MTDDARRAAPRRNEDDGEEEDDARSIPSALSDRAHHALAELLYSADAFTAVASPVMVTVVVTAICVVWINDGLNGRSPGGNGIPVVFEEQPGQSTEQLITGAVVNALVIIAVIIAATFVMVFLFWLGFVKLLIAYLVASTALLLAISTGLVVQVGLWIYSVPTDAITFAFIFYNFAVGGVVAIFYGKGVPKVVGQAYLVVVSVTMAWILLRYLPAWTSWVLLGALALYDLCAVLTPCGPLNLLVQVMQERQQPLPGLLYEASLGGDRAAPSTGAAPLPPPAAPSAASSPPHREREQERERDAERGERPPPRPDVAPPSRAQWESAAAAAAAQHHQHHHHQQQQQHRHQHNTPDDLSDLADDVDDRSIKLGLGDFVFYSLLCAHAALVSFTCFAAVTASVLLGLGLSLIHI